MYIQLLAQMKKQLRHIDAWLTAAEEFAKAKSFDPNVLLQQRLAPDQFQLVRQVQIACDTAKNGIARITGKDAPALADTEQTIAELRTRITTTLLYLDTIGPSDFEGTATRVVTSPRWGGKIMLGGDYFVEHALPNFFFHLNHVYAILRHNGVNLGKANYLGALTLREPA